MRDTIATFCAVALDTNSKCFVFLLGSAYTTSKVEEQALLY